MGEHDYSDVDNISKSSDEIQWLFISSIVFGIILCLGGMYVATIINGIGGGIIVVGGLILIGVGSTLLHDHNEMREQYTGDLKEYTDLLPKLKKSDYILTDNNVKFIKELHKNYKKNTFEDLDDNYSKWIDICHNHNCHNGSTIEKDGECKCVCDEDFEGDDCNTRKDVHNYDEIMEECTDSDGTKNELVPEEECKGNWKNYTIPSEDKKTITNKDLQKIDCIDPKYCRNYCERIENEWCQHGLVDKSLHRSNDETGVNYVPVCLDKEDEGQYECLHHNTHKKHLEKHCKKLTQLECRNHSLCKWDGTTCNRNSDPPSAATTPAAPGSDPGNCIGKDEPCTSKDTCCNGLSCDPDSKTCNKTKYCWKCDSGPRSACLATNPSTSDVTCTQGSECFDISKCTGSTKAAATTTAATTTALAFQQNQQDGSDKTTAADNAFIVGGLATI